MKHIDFLLAISQETDQAKLHQMSQTIRDRLQALAKLHVSTVKVGDTVRFVDTINPKYLRGLSAKVVKLNRNTVSVSCPSDSRYGRFSGHSKVRVPLSLVTV